MKISKIINESEEKSLLASLEDHLRQIDRNGVKFKSSGFSSAAAHDKEVARMAMVKKRNAIHTKEAEAIMAQLDNLGGNAKRQGEKLWKRYTVDLDKALKSERAAIVASSVKTIITVLSKLNTNPRGKGLDEILPVELNDRNTWRKVSDELGSLRTIRDSSGSFIWDEQDKSAELKRFLRKKFGNEGELVWIKQHMTRNWQSRDFRG